MLRVTPGVEAHTHEYIETGTEDSKFGFTVRPGDALEAARRVAASPHLELAGLHCHIGSQIHVLQSYALAAAVVVGLVAEIEAQPEAGPGAVTELNLGGGLGIAYHDGDDPPAVAEYAAVLQRAVDDAVAHAGLSHRPAVLVEPGRSIAASAGVTLYRVGTIKEIAGVRTYVAVDGGMSDNARPAMYGARYEAFLPERVTAPSGRWWSPWPASTASRATSLVRNATLPADLAVGRPSVSRRPPGPTATPWPATTTRFPGRRWCSCAAVSARVVVRRETVDDLLQLEAE